MSKYKFASLLFFLMLMFGLEVAAQKNKSNTLLWQISKNKLQQPSFLFGTIHVICAEDYFWTAKMQQAFDRTEQLCLEMDLSQKDISMETAALLMDFSGTTLRDYFSSADDYALVKKYIEDSLKQDINIVERMKPVALYLLYSAGIVQAPCARTESYELNLVAKAQSSQKKVLGLETLAEQVETLESIPTDSIINQLLRIAKGDQEDVRQTGELIKAYKRQDLDQLNALLVSAEMAGQMDVHNLLDKRNKKWVQPIQNMMKDKPTFIAVGAGHLKGLLELLRKEGYQVEPF